MLVAASLWMTQWAVAAVPQAAAPQAQEIVTVGVFLIAPYVIDSDDGPKGALVEFYDKEIAPRMGVRFKWERPMTTPRLERSLITSQVQFTPILSRTAERERAGVQFAGDANIRFKPCVAVLPDSALTAVRTPADLQGYTVGWVQGGALPPFMLDKRIRLDLVGSVNWGGANLEKLRLGRIGAAYFSNYETPQYMANQAGIKIRLLDVPTKGTTLHAAFSAKAPRTLIERYERAAAEAFANGNFTVYLNRAIDTRPAD